MSGGDMTFSEKRAMVAALFGRAGQPSYQDDNTRITDRLDAILVVLGEINQKLNKEKST